VAGLGKRARQAGQDHERAVVADRHELAEGGRGVLLGVVRLDLVVGVLPVPVLGVFLLNPAAVLEHDGSQVAGRRRRVDRPGKALLDQVRQVAAVVDVGVAEDDRLQLGGRDGEVAVGLSRLAAMALVQAAIDGQPTPAGLDVVHRARDLPGGPVEQQVHPPVALADQVLEQLHHALDRRPIPHGTTSKGPAGDDDTAGANGRTGYFRPAACGTTCATRL
jgi:hypothetical protein